MVAKFLSSRFVPVPASVERVLQKTQIGVDAIDLFVFHQANKYMLEHLRKKMKIPEENFIIGMSHSGNTVSSSIPIAEGRYGYRTCTVGDSCHACGIRRRVLVRRHTSAGALTGGPLGIPGPL
jgi:hypothetical protein